MIEPSDSVLMDKGFIGTIARLTLENIDDPDFCQNSSYAIYVTSESMESKSQVTEFFHEIKGFDLISALFKLHNSNDAICFNCISILIKIIINFPGLMEIGISFKPLFKSGLIETIAFIMEKSKDDSFVKLCELFFTIIVSSSK